MDETSFYAQSAGNQNDGKALVRTAGSREIVGEVTIGNPLLRAIHDVMLTILGLLGIRAQAHDVATGKRLGNS